MDGKPAAASAAPPPTTSLAAPTPLQQLPATIQNAGVKRPQTAATGLSMPTSLAPPGQGQFSVIAPPVTTQSGQATAGNQNGMRNAAATAQFRFNNGGPMMPPPRDTPQIYSAIYSGVDVYEMEMNSVAVMRRRKDSWLNATQILKVAKIDKGKRTKILEKEIQTGEHEKVQGGYGKYQGTWVKFERGLEICRQYGVEEMLRPLLTHDMGQDGGVAGQDTNTPTKEQAMAAQRKRMYTANAAAENRGAGVQGTFFRNISQTASHAVAAISKARMGSPGPRGRAGSGTPSSRAPSFSRTPSGMGNGEGSFVSGQPAGGTSQGMTRQPSFTSETSTTLDPSGPTTQVTVQESVEPPRKRPRGNLTPAESFSYGGETPTGSFTQGAFPASPTEVNESFVYKNAGVTASAGDSLGPLQPLPYDMSPETEERKAQLLRLFLDANMTDAQIQEGIAGLSSTEIDMPIDQHCHTVLHWAAALSRMSLLRALIAAGANAFRVNAVGQTALMRACTVTNSMELNTFPELLDVLGCTLSIRDHKGRTVLHQIAVTSAVKGRNAASRYYLESLLEWVVRQGSVPSSQQSSQEAQVSLTGAPKMGLARFMAEIVNAQDHSGDTALNIAAKNGNKSVISQLLEVGADPNIANRSGLRPVDFGIGIGTDITPPDPTVSITPQIPSTTPAPTIPSSTPNQTNDEIISSISLILTGTTSSFTHELASKQATLDTLHHSIRLASQSLTISRKHLETLQARLQKQTHARQQIANLTHARDDEQFRGARDGLAGDVISTWETQLAASLAEAATDPVKAAESLPSAQVLKGRVRALTERKEVMRKMVAALKGRSKETEVKYCKVVSLCTGVPVEEVDAVVEGLLRAVESEKAELELGRVRRFLGGVEGVGR